MMKTLQFVTMCAGLFFVAQLWAQSGPPVADYPVDQVAGKVWVIHGPVTTPNKKNQGFMNNPGFILTSKGMVIVDPGGTLQSGEMVLRVMKTISDKPVIAVFNTHMHGDHWLGNQAVKAAYPDAPIYAHPNMIREVAEGEGKNWQALMLRQTGGQSAGTIVVNADHPINNGDHFNYGDTRLKIYHYGAAHTDNDIMISVDGGKALFMGDNLINGRLGNMRNGNIKGLIDADAKVIGAVQPAVIIPGHGRSGGMAMYNHSVDLFRILYRNVQQLYDQDMSDYEMKPRIRAALKDYRDWVDFDALLGKTISQAYLEVEAADF